METLRFLIKGQMIKKDPACPFNRMVAGSSNYYIAEFEMDDAWTGYSCVAKFNVDGKLSYGGNQRHDQKPYGNTRLIRKELLNYDYTYWWSLDSRIYLQQQ